METLLLNMMVYLYFYMLFNRVTRFIKILEMFCIDSKINVIISVTFHNLLVTSMIYLINEQLTSYKYFVIY